MIPAFLVALAVGLRLCWVLLVPTRPVGDFAMYFESAEHLVEHGGFDAEFIYMPGYVLLLAALRAAGGGWLAAKLVGVAAGGLATGAAYGIARRLWDRRAAVAAGALCAIWPAGIAVASVTGTDMPAAALLAAAVYVLGRLGARRPLAAAGGYGLILGLAALVRAVALPLVALAPLYFAARGLRVREAAKLGAVAALLTIVVLAPWAVRNRLRYGEWSWTDQHGGLTALVGSNPNTDGRYSRSLNHMFREATGLAVLREPHLEADQAAYALALKWALFAPRFSLGLAIAKAERLLGNERALLYWPLYRAGVLREPERSWFAARRGAIEDVCDAFWVLLVAAAAAGFGVAAARAHRPGLWLLSFPFVLLVLHAVFFAEPRYHLPIAVLLFPPAGAGLAWGAQAAWRSLRRLPRDAGAVREAAVAGACVLALFLLWPQIVHAGERLRERHRWAVSLCRVEGAAQFCKWRGSGPVGVWNGAGVDLPARGEAVLFTELPLTAGSYRLRAHLDLAPPASAGPPVIGGTVSVVAGENQAAWQVVLARVDRESRGGRQIAVERTVNHRGGPLRVRLAARTDTHPPGTRLWLSDLAIERGR